MLAISGRPRAFLCHESTDMRCSFAGLVSRTKQIIREDPLSGYLFVFFNRRRDYTKLLYWDEDGYCIWSKRLQSGTFEVPTDGKIEIDAKKLMLILEGISLKNVKRRKRFFLKK